jgi:hypothetical protein
LVFVVEFVIEQIIFLPLTVMVLLLGWHWWRSRRSITAIPDAAS